jgi:hypothetical protein
MEKIKGKERLEYTLRSLPAADRKGLWDYFDSDPNAIHDMIDWVIAGKTKKDSIAEKPKFDKRKRHTPLAPAPNTIAHELIQHAQDAAGDMGHDMTTVPYDDKIKRKIAKLKRNGVTDITGRLADDYYNDVSFLTDIIGDKLYVAVGKDNVLRKAVCAELERLGHPALKKAAKQLAKD